MTSDISASTSSQSWLIEEVGAPDLPAFRDFVIWNHLRTTCDSLLDLALQLDDLPSDYPYLLSVSKFLEGKAWWIRSDDSIEGTISLSFFTEKSISCAKIQSLHVSPLHQRKGRGSALLQFAINYCRERGVQRVELITLKEKLKPAVQLYLNSGFLIVEEEIHRFPSSSDPSSSFPSSSSGLSLLERFAGPLYLGKGSVYHVLLMRLDLVENS